MNTHSRCSSMGNGLLLIMAVASCLLLFRHRECQAASRVLSYAYFCLLQSDGKGVRVW